MEAVAIWVPPTVTTRVGAAAYPIPGLVIAIDVTDKLVFPLTTFLEIMGEKAAAATRAAGAAGGAAILMVGAVTYPLPRLVTKRLTTLPIASMVV